MVHRAGRSGSPHNQRSTHPLTSTPTPTFSSSSYSPSPLVEQDAEAESASAAPPPPSADAALSPLPFSKRRRLNPSLCAVSDVPPPSPLLFSAASEPLTPTLAATSCSSSSSLFLYTSPSFSVDALPFDDFDVDTRAALIRHSSEPSSPVSVAESSYSFYSTSTHTSASSTSSVLFPSSPIPLPSSVLSALAAEKRLSDGLHRCPIPDLSAGLHFHDHVHGRSWYHHPGPSVSRAEAVNRVFLATAFVVYSTLLHPKDVLRKWADLQQAWDGFDVRRVARYGHSDVQRLLEGRKLIKDKVKVAAIIHNATVIDAMESRQPGSFLQLLWAPHTQPNQPFPISERILPLSPHPPISPSDALDCVNFSCKPSTATVADGVTVTASIYALRSALQSVKVKRMAHDGCLLFAQMIGLVNHHQRRCYAWSFCEDEYHQVLAARMATS